MALGEGKNDEETRFKPQRGKFTRLTAFLFKLAVEQVSNPNGVNLHAKEQQRILQEYKDVSNPNGVNLHKFAGRSDYLFFKFQTPTG